MPTAAKRIGEARTLLAALGLPKEQTNERAALTLLALLDLRATAPWTQARNPMLGILGVMAFARDRYGKRWKANTRETVRRFTIHQFEQAGLVVANPDRPDRPVNSPDYCYQVPGEVLDLVRRFKADDWPGVLRRYLRKSETLRNRYAQIREMARIPLDLGAGQRISLTPGGQNTLVKVIIEEFGPRFAPAARPVYVGDTGEKWAFFDELLLASLGVSVDSHGKMPDVVLYLGARNWLILIEAVTSHGPVSPKRLAELKQLFRGCSAGLVFVTAFLDRSAFAKYQHDIAWETEVWVASSPDHMVHFNGERFLGPYSGSSGSPG